MTRVLLPPAMAAQACACAGVGSLKAAVNQSRVTGLKQPSGSGGIAAGRPGRAPAAPGSVTAPGVVGWRAGTLLSCPLAPTTWTRRAAGGQRLLGRPGPSGEDRSLQAAYRAGQLASGAAYLADDRPHAGVPGALAGHDVRLGHDRGGQLRIEVAADPGRAALPGIGGDRRRTRPGLPGQAE